ncbi:MAG: hypothetical protein V1732_05300 [Patescibacteria group bacterium]
MSLGNLKDKIFNDRAFFVALLVIGILAILSFIFGLIAFNDEILFLTFLALVWYASETQKIREIEEKPIVDLFYRPQKQSLKLRNTGKGTAYNIKVENTETEDRIFWFYFEDPNLILINGNEQSLYVNIKNKKDNSYRYKELNDFLNYITYKSFNKLKKLTDKQKTKIIISYQNALDKKFQRIFYIYSRNMSGVDDFFKKDIEVEFYKEKIL